MTLLSKVKHSPFLVYVISVRSQTVQETKTGQFALLTSLHPVSVNDSQAAATQSGMYNEIMGLPFDPRGCVQQESTLVFRIDSVRAPSLSPSIHPPTAPRTMAYSTEPVLHYGACGLAVQQASDFNHMYCTQIKRVSPGSMSA